MKSKGLIFISCLAAGALVSSPAMAKPEKKSSVSRSNRSAAHTTQVTRHNQNMGSTRYYGGTRYTGTRSYAGRQYTGTRYYPSGTRYYNNYYGGSRGYYYGGGYPNYSYYSGYPYGSSAVWPYVAASVASSALAPGYSGYPYSYYGGYPYSGYNNYYSYYGGYPYSGYNRYSYYTPTSRYNGSMVAAVQQRLGRLGYYHGVVDGVIGPQTHNAIAAFESRNGLAVDGMIDRAVLDRLGLS
jgi:Putative peptidoglycan binding domain